MKIFKSGSVGTPSLLYYEGKAAEAIVPGEALVLTDGFLTKCGATTKPQFIAQGGGTGCVIPVIRVSAEDTYKARFTASAAALKVGNAVTLDSTATGITATTTSGVATIVSIFGTAVGDEAEICFK